MPTGFDLSRIPNKETVCYKPGVMHLGALIDEADLSPVTHALILLAPIIGVRRLDDDQDVREFALRVGFYEHLFGPLLTVAVDGDLQAARPITFEDVQAHRGLRTSASNASRMEFASRMLRAFERVITDAPTLPTPARGRDEASAEARIE